MGYRCNYPECDKTFTRKYDCQQHEKHVHNPPRYHCPIPGCDKMFKWKNSIPHHLKFSHNFDDSLRVPCPYPECDTLLKGTKNLTTHIRSVHSDIRYKCLYSDCHKEYKTKSKLNEHIRFVHEKIRAHTCERCGKEYRRLEELRNHWKRNLCWSPRLTDHRDELISEHDNAATHLKNFLKETKYPKFVQSETILSNQRRLDLFVRCPNDQQIGFDVTIGRSTAANLRYAIIGKFHKGYEHSCDVTYVFVISKVKHARQTINECDRSPVKPKTIRVVDWRAIIGDHPKYAPIFQHIEDDTVL